MYYPTATEKMRALKGRVERAKIEQRRIKAIKDRATRRVELRRLFSDLLVIEYERRHLMNEWRIEELFR